MNVETKKSTSVPLIAIIVLAIVFFFPRLILSWMGPANPWTCYLYQYGLGAVVFSIGIFLILKTGACQLGRGHDSYWFKWQNYHRKSIT